MPGGSPSWSLQQWQARRVVLAWADNTETDLAASPYRVYRSTTQGFTPGPSNLLAGIVGYEYTP